jgi:oligopeptidase A
MTLLTSDNPLLIGKGIPPFNEIKAEQIVPAITTLLEQLTTDLNKLEATVTPSWEGLVEPLTAIEESISWSWGVVGHLMGVKNSPELREAYQNIQPMVVQFFNQLGQSKPIYEAFKAIKASPQWSTLESAQQRIVESSIQDAELSGVGLEGEKRDRFNQIQLELAELSTNFSNNVLDATKAFQLKLTQPEEIAGLPPSLLSLAAQTATGEGEEGATPEHGPWVITLDYPSYVPFLKYSSNQKLRGQVYHAFISRASTGELNNYPNLERILALRQEKAQLLGFNTYAQLSLARKMAPDIPAVETLLEELRQVSYPAAIEELEQLKTFAGTTDLQPWDISYWAEKQRENLFAFTDEELRPYFSLEQVLNGLFDLSQRLFGIKITPADGTAPVWHQDVRYFQISDQQGEAIAYFYLDAYSRPAEKRGGAWMGTCINRSKINDNGQTTIRLPIAYLICNQSPPLGEQPSLMTFVEVTTLFHEFGHGLQHMLTEIDYSGAAGINNIEWDAVELPSQFMENWCYEHSTLMGMAKHYQTGESLPQDYYQKLLAARNYLSAMSMLRQLHFSIVDLELHHGYQPGGAETSQQLRDRLAATTMVMPPLPDDAFLCSFGHIFSGGYAAGYYSYKWAEVLSADAFGAFEEAGLDSLESVQNIGLRFRDTVLALGGSLPPMEVFTRFRGREPKTEALLRHSGLLTTVG